MKKKETRNNSSECNKWPSINLLDYIQVKEKNELLCSYGPNENAGVYIPKSSQSFPAAKYDFNGQTGDSWFHDFHDLSGKDLSSLILFRHSNYDQNNNGLKYKVKVEFIGIDNAFAGNTRSSSDAPQEGKNIGLEWFMDHIIGNVESGNITQSYGINQAPWREAPKYTGDNNHGFDENYFFPEVTCSFNQAIAFITRGFEKDVSPLDLSGEEYGNNFEDWVTLFKDFGAAIMDDKWGRFVYDCVAMIFRAIEANTDDPMNPALTVFSHGACRFIHEECGGKIYFLHNKIYGMNASKARYTLNGYPNLVNFVQLIDDNTNRGYNLKYHVSVEPV